MSINEFLKQPRKGHVLPALVCADGLKMSVQASGGHYCTPRTTDADYYSAVEVGYPNRVIPELLPFAEEIHSPMDTVYGYVPVRVVDYVIEKAGGIVK